jgi:predicted HicB family RNase H-like nuclease
MPWPRDVPRGDGRPTVRPTDIDADLYRQARDRAKADGVSVRSLIEAALRMYLESDRNARGVNHG